VTEHYSWALSVGGLALLTAVPFMLVGKMKQRRTSVVYAIWLTAGSSAAGYALLVTGATLEDPNGASVALKVVVGFGWWRYLVLVSEVIAISWKSLPRSPESD
jgi:hypothetical protein